MSEIIITSVKISCPEFDNRPLIYFHTKVCRKRVTLLNISWTEFDNRILINCQIENEREACNIRGNLVARDWQSIIDLFSHQEWAMKLVEFVKISWPALEDRPLIDFQIDNERKHVRIVKISWPELEKRQSINFQNNFSDRESWRIL